MSENIKIRKVVVVGAGFAGISLVKRLAQESVDITLIDKNNYNVFIPLLYQVATAGLSPADISVPIRHIFAKQSNVEVIMDEVTQIEQAQAKVITKRGEYVYDELVICTGASYNYFGHEAWEKQAPSLRTVPDALLIRSKILGAFEKAETLNAAEQRMPYQTFCVVGAGPTGVEVAGAIAELSKNVLQSEFRKVDVKQCKIYLLEAGPRILAGFSEKLSEKSMQALEKLGVNVQLNAKVESITDGQVQVNGETILAETVIWAAGVKVSKVSQWLGAESDKIGRVLVKSDLSVGEGSSIFVIGDAAHVQDASGKPLPGLAPVAIQQGDYVARLIAHRIQNKSFNNAFVYQDKGILATVGRSFAVAEIGQLKFSGFVAWIFWALVHIFQLAGFRNRFLVFSQWVWAYMTYERGARLIVDHDESESNQ